MFAGVMRMANGHKYTIAQIHFYLQKVKKVLSAHNKCLNVLHLAFTKQNVIFWERFIDAQNKRELEGRSEGSPFPAFLIFEALMY